MSTTLVAFQVFAVAERTLNEISRRNEEALNIALAVL
jgi:hypothetical protein